MRELANTAINPTAISFGQVISLYEDFIFIKRKLKLEGYKVQNVCIATE